MREILPIDDVVGSNYHQAFHSAVPGILTGLGLALTFLAILLALAGVTYDKTNLTEPVTGMEGLINGLSGKFVSSILALALSVAFTFLERATTRRVRRAHERLLAVSSQVFPYLSPSRILLDIQRFSRKQTVSVSHISSEVVDRFVGAFRTEVTPALADGVSAGMALKLQDEFRPTMQQMNATLADLSAAITALPVSDVLPNEVLRLRRVVLQKHWRFLRVFLVGRVGRQPVPAMLLRNDHCILVRKLSLRPLF
jgi:hypothetical protein